jgi:hypothetical protein
MIDFVKKSSILLKLINSLKPDDIFNLLWHMVLLYPAYLKSDGEKPPLCPLLDKSESVSLA